MNKRELELHAELLERKFELAQPDERQKLRPSIEKLIRTLNASDQPIPTSLRRLGERLDQDIYDDMFDNMPV